MPRYEVAGPDGKKYEVHAPEGASHDDAINYVKGNFYAISPMDSNPHIKRAQSQSALDNLIEGAGGGVKSLYLGGKQLLGQASPEEISAHKQKMEGLRSTTAGTIGDIGGQIGAAIPAMFIPGVNKVVGASLLGGALGALQPVDKDESRATNVLVGGAGGVAGKYLGDAIGSLVSKVSSRLRAPEQAQQAIQVELTKQGIDFSKLNAETQKSLLDDATEALKGGGTLDPEALSRKLDFELLGIKPTQGQLTRDPLEFQFEQNSRGIVGGGESLSQRFNEQNTGLIDRLNQTRAGMGQGADRYNAGESAIQVLKSQDAARKANVDKLYESARNAAGIHTPLDGHTFTQSLNDALDQQMLGDALPGGVRSVLNQIGEGKLPFTVQKAEQIRQAINGQMPKIPDRTSTALHMVNRALQNEIDRLGDTLGGEAGNAFKSARQAATHRFSELDKSPALKAATEGFEPDDFINKFVIRAKPGELLALRANVQNEPELWNEMRGQVIDFLKNKAVSGQVDEFAKFSQSGYKKGLDSIGDARLKILFKPEEIAELKRIHRVAASIMVQPTGSAVNNSGTSQAVANLLSRLSNVPYLKEMAVNPLINYRTQQKVSQSLTPGLTVRPGAKPANSKLSRLLPVTGGTATGNLQNY